MKSWKIALIPCLLWFLIQPTAGYADFSTIERGTSYKIEYQNLNFFERLFVRLMGYEFLQWEEMNIKELVIKDTASGKSEVIVMSVMPTRTRELVYLKNGGEVWGFVNFTKYDKLDKEKVALLMTIHNYFYDSEDGESEFVGPNFLGNKQKSVYFKTDKQKVEDKYLIKVVILDDKQKPIALAEVVINPLPEKSLEYISIELKVKPRIKIVLTKKPRS